MDRCYSCFREFEEAYGVCPFCGEVYDKSPKEATHLFPGTILGGRYIIGKAVGVGGFGIVYKAWDTKLEIIIAVKEFFVSNIMTRAVGVKEPIVSKKKIDEFTYHKNRFIEEARTMAKFGKHKNIPNVFEVFEENNTAYIVMELLEGVRLDEYLEQVGGTIETDFSLYIINEVGKALESMHQLGVIHRDVSPDNIFICYGQEINIKLLDLGAAKLDSSDDEGLAVILKPGYSPPEQYEPNGKVGTWSDVYALGATLYLLLTSVKPIESTNRKEKDDLPQPIELNPAISQNLNNTVMKALAIDRHMRFKTVSEFLKGANDGQRVETLAHERKRKKIRRFSGVAIASVILAVITFFVVGSFQQKRHEQDLDAATITVWFSVSENSSEEEAMISVFTDFMQRFDKVIIEYRAIPENEYFSVIQAAAETDSLPNLFESTGLSESIVSKALDLDSVINSQQFSECFFLDQYDEYYDSHKRVPLAIVVPLAYVITSGATEIDFPGEFFSSVEDFGSDTVISIDSRYSQLIARNINVNQFVSEDAFLTMSGNSSPVLLSSSMIINEVRSLPYVKKCVYYNGESIRCDFTYEWSIGGGNDSEVRASETLLSWMLGNVYQSYLMVNSGTNGQIPEIPVNKECFETKINLLSNLKPLSQIYMCFSFDRKD